MKTRLYILWILCLLAGQQAQAQYDLGTPAYSTLTWAELRTAADLLYSIGRTKDGRVYVWGLNVYSEIHTRKVKSNDYQVQTTPFYVPLPSGEIAKKVDVTRLNTAVSGGYGAIPSVAFATLTQNN